MATRRCGLCVWLACCLVGACGGVVCTTLYAETHTATSLTPEAVWAAIDAANDGDTVLLPAGTANWTKGWNADHSANMKAITIQGAGIGQTIIHDSRDPAYGSNVLFWMLGVEGQSFRVTGITFDGSGNTKAGPMMSIGGDCKDFRIDNCEFKNANQMMMISGDTYGVIDHCYINAAEYKGGNVQTIFYQGAGISNFYKPLSLGTAEALYFEDNLFSFTPEVVNPTGNNPCIVPNNGARTVIRNNTIINSQLEIYCSGMNSMPASQQCEIYGNDFSAVGLDPWRPQVIVMVSGGTVLAFDNTATGTTYNHPNIMVGNQRAVRDWPGYPMADGTLAMDGNWIGPGELGAGYPCFGQPGWATVIDGVFEPTPCYAWDNTLNGNPLPMTLDSRAGANEAATLVEGRDFFNEEPPLDYYKPYVYPHPLVVADLTPGDANADGLVDGQDLALWQQHYDPLGFNQGSFYTADWNFDGIVDGQDLALWQTNYDPLGVRLEMSAAHAPEPATLGLLALGGLALLRRRRSA